MSDPTAHLLVPLVVLLLAGAVKGVAGLGLPTVGVGLLSLVMTPVSGAARRGVTAPPRRPLSRPAGTRSRRS